MKTPLQPLVIVILPKPEQCEAVCQQVRQRDMVLRIFSTFDDCLQEFQENTAVPPCCIVCPLAIDSLSGLRFQRQLGRLPQVASIVFFDLPSAVSEVVEAMRQGAIAVVDVRDDLSRLIAFIEEGLERSCRQFHDQQRCRDIGERLASLSPGELDVLHGIIAGKRNKEIARDLQLSIRTIEQRRRDLFRKMDVQSVALLVRKVPSTLYQDAFSESQPTLSGARHVLLGELNGFTPAGVGQS